MKRQVEVPPVGESISKGLLSAWLKRTGELVNEGDDLFELETDKATMAIPARASGVLEIVVPADTEVEIGQVVGQIDTEAKVTATSAAPPQAPRVAAAGDAPPQAPRVAAAGDAPPQAPRVAAAGDAPPQASRVAAAGAAPPPRSPAVRRLLDEHGLEPAAIPATGKGGRLTKADVLQRLVEQAPAAAPTAPGPAAARQDRRRMTPLRRTIAEHLVASRQAAAHLTTFNEVDLSRVMEIRGAYREAFEKKHGVRLGFMSFFVKASVQALSEWREVNAFIDGDEIVYNNFYDIGVAVSIEQGLVVPVLRDAGSKSFGAIEREIADLAARARDRKLTVDEMSGGTFTITNGGVFGSLLSTPIPNPPQTAVLGMHAIQKRPVVVNDQIVIRPMMYLALTYDHRLIDGRQAVGFLVRVKGLVEDPTQLLLDL